MLSWLIRKQIDAFGRRWSYDTSYMRTVLEEAGPGAVMPLNGLGKVGAYRRDVPAGVYYAAKVTASIAADCGPCAQLAVGMAEEAGVAPAVVRALVAGDLDALPADERLGAELARATLARKPGTEIRDAIVARWGYRGLVSIAYGIVAAQAYPTLKYALGAATSCVRLHAGGAEVGAKHPVAM